MVIMNGIEKVPFTSCKLIIPKEVDDKIRFLCESNWDREWSGILFYDYTGTFRNNNLVLTCKDILLMDIGSSAYTEFKVSEDIASYLVEHPELMDCVQGLVHSHNNMSTNFSGTDLATLQEEGKDIPIFLSLIVNNAGKYTAMVTRMTEKTTKIRTKETYNFFGEGKKVEEKEKEETKTVVQYYKLIVEREFNNLYPEVSDRINSIKDKNQMNITFPDLFDYDENYEYSQLKTL